VEVLTSVQRRRRWSAAEKLRLVEESVAFLRADRVQLTAYENARAERWVRSAKDECLSKIILFGERSLRRAIKEYVEHYHTERNHQGKGNVLLFQRVTEARRDNPLQCRERLGGLLRYYYQNAA
jgi:Integrase core domain